MSRITLIPTRNIDAIEWIGNHPDIVNGATNGTYFRYDPGCQYVIVEIMARLAGAIYFREVQPMSYDVHAMFLPEFRGALCREASLMFLRQLFENTNAQCVTTFAARKFRYGQMFAVSVGLKRVGTIRKYFSGRDDVTLYAATREEIMAFTEENMHG